MQDNNRNSASTITAFAILAPIAFVAVLWYAQIGIIVADYEHAKIERNCPGHRHAPFEKLLFATFWPFAGMDIVWDLVPRDQLVCDRFD